MPGGGAVAVVGATRHDHAAITSSGGAWVVHGLSGCNANSTIDTCEIGIPGDMNGDGLVDGTDIQLFIDSVLNG